MDGRNPFRTTWSPKKPRMIPPQMPANVLVPTIFSSSQCETDCLTRPPYRGRNVAPPQPCNDSVPLASHGFKVVRHGSHPRHENVSSRPVCEPTDRSLHKKLPLQGLKPEVPRSPYPSGAPQASGTRRCRRRSTRAPGPRRSSGSTAARNLSFSHIFHTAYSPT